MSGIEGIEILDCGGKELDGLLLEFMRFLIIEFVFDFGVLVFGLGVSVLGGLDTTLDGLDTTLDGRGLHQSFSLGALHSFISLPSLLANIDRGRLEMFVCLTLVVVLCIED